MSSLSSAQELVSGYATALQQVRGRSLRDEVDVRITEPLRDLLKRFCGLSDGVELLMAPDGLMVGDQIVGLDFPSADAAAGRLRDLNVGGVYLPAWITDLQMWRLLIITAMEPDRVIQAGGFEYCLERAGCSIVRVRELPVPPSADTVGFAPLPELEEINQRLKDPSSGDTVESMPFAKPKSKDEQVRTYTKLTREIVRAFGPDGPDACARALLLTWRRIAVVTTESNDADLDVHRVTAMMHRLDPLIRFAVLAQIGYTKDGKSIAALIPDGELVHCISAAIVWDYPGGHTACAAVLRTARKQPIERQPVLDGISKRLEELGRRDDPIWQAILESSTSAK